MVVQAEHEVHAAEHQHGGADHAPDKLRRKVLHLGNVIGDPGDQRPCSEAVHLWKGKGHDPPEAVFSNLIADVLAGQMYKHIVQGAACSAE